MTVLNRDAFLATEPEIDVSQFKDVKLDLHYADLSPNQILDVWYPDEGEGPYPVVILFHGGAFGTGHKRSFYISSMALPVTQGYAVATVEYRLYNEALWPAQLIDAKAAVRYLRAHAKELNLNPDKFLVWGNSAGGCATQILALSGDNPAADDLSVGEQASSKVQGAIAWYSVNEFISQEAFTVTTHAIQKSSGVMDGMVPKEAQGSKSPIVRVLGYDPLRYPERIANQTPLSYVTEDCPPMLLQHGTNDMIVTCHQSQLMYDRITEICGEGRAELDLFEGEGHGSQKIKALENVERCMDFIDKVLMDGKNPYRKPLERLRIVQ